MTSTAPCNFAWECVWVFLHRNFWCANISKTKSSTSSVVYARYSCFSIPTSNATCQCGTRTARVINCAGDLPVTVPKLWKTSGDARQIRPHLLYRNYTTGRVAEGWRYAPGVCTVGDVPSSRTYQRLRYHQPMSDDPFCAPVTRARGRVVLCASERVCLYNWWSAKGSQGTFHLFPWPEYVCVFTCVLDPWFV